MHAAGKHGKDNSMYNNRVYVSGIDNNVLASLALSQRQRL